MPVTPTPTPDVPASADGRTDAPPPLTYLPCSSCGHRYPTPEALRVHQAKCSARESRASASASAREGSAPAARQIHTEQWRICPHCHQMQTEYMVLGREPAYLMCHSCQRVSAREAWRLGAIGSVSP